MSKNVVITDFVCVLLGKLLRLYMKDELNMLLLIVPNFSWGQGSPSVSGAKVCPLIGAECPGPSGRAGSDTA